VWIEKDDEVDDKVLENAYWGFAPINMADAT
jgi:hypothetical protein